MSAATPALVWWCARYQRVEDNEGYCHSNRYPTRGESHNETDAGCGPRLLVDPSALVVERDAKGEWPEWMRDRAKDFDEYVVWDWMRVLVEAEAARREAST